MTKGADRIKMENGEYAVSTNYLMSGENRSHNGLPSVEEAKERFLFNRIRVPFTRLDKQHRITYNHLHTNGGFTS